MHEYKKINKYFIYFITSKIKEIYFSKFTYCKLTYYPMSAEKYRDWVYPGIDLWFLKFGHLISIIYEMWDEPKSKL